MDFCSSGDTHLYTPEDVEAWGLDDQGLGGKEERSVLYTAVPVTLHRVQQLCFLFAEL